MSLFFENTVNLHFNSKLLFFFFFRFLYFIEHDANKNNNQIYDRAVINPNKSTNQLQSDRWFEIESKWFSAFVCFFFRSADKMRIKWSDFYFRIWLKFRSPLAGRDGVFHTKLFRRLIVNFRFQRFQIKRKSENFRLFFWKVPLLSEWKQILYTCVTQVNCMLMIRKFKTHISNPRYNNARAALVWCVRLCCGIVNDQ